MNDTLEKQVDSSVVQSWRSGADRDIHDRHGGREAKHVPVTDRVATWGCNLSVCMSLQIQGYKLRACKRAVTVITTKVILPRLPAMRDSQMFGLERTPSHLQCIAFSIILF